MVRAAEIGLPKVKKPCLPKKTREDRQGVKGDKGLCAYGVVAVARELCVVGGVLTVRTVERELGDYYRAADDGCASCAVVLAAHVGNLPLHRL